MAETFPFDDVRADVFTTTVIAATGATTLVNAFGTNQSILVDQLRVVSLTDTLGQVEFSFGDTTTVGHFSGVGTGIGELMNLQFVKPWMLATNAALSFAATVSSAGLPSLRVTARVRNSRRAIP